MRFEKIQQVNRDSIDRKVEKDYNKKESEKRIK